MYNSPAIRGGTSHGIRRFLLRNWWFYAMLLPGLLYITIFNYVPMYGILIAFKDYSIFRGFSDSPWVGMEIFTKLFAQSGFRRALENNIIISLQKLIGGFPTPIILSLMLNEFRRAGLKKCVQTAIILPNFISWIVINGLLFAIFSTRIGAFTGLLRSLGVENVPDILADKNHFRLVILFSYLWRSGGYGTIIYLSAIAGIDQEQYESARIDGAGRFRCMRYITLPGLKQVSLVVTTLMFIWGFNNFDIIFLLTSGGPLNATRSLSIYTYNLAFYRGRMGYSAAISLITFALMIGFYGFYQRALKTDERQAKLRV